MLEPSPGKISCAGLSLMELVIAGAIISFSLVTLSLVLLQNKQSDQLFTDQITASMDVRQEMEKQIISPDFAIDQSTTTRSYGQVTYSYQWLSPYLKQVIITSTASSSLGLSPVNKQKTIAKVGGLLADWRYAREADTCDLSLSDWSHPTVINAVGITTTPGSVGTAITVRHGLVYLAVDSAQAIDPDLYIVDVTDPLQPSILVATSTGPGLADVVVIDDYAYLANKSSKSQLQIIDVSDPSNLVLESETKVNAAFATTLNYYHDRLYLGTEKDPGPEFYRFDVSDPAHPTYSPANDTFEFGPTTNAIAVVGSRAYVANTSIDTLKVLDLSESLIHPAITKINQISFSPRFPNQNAHAITALGPDLYVGRTYGGTGQNHPELSRFFDQTFNRPISDPLPVIPIATTSLAKLGASVEDLFVRDKKVFVASATAGKELQVWSAANQNLSLISSVSLADLPISISCDGNTLYVAVASSTGFVVIKDLP